MWSQGNFQLKWKLLDPETHASFINNILFLFLEPSILDRRFHNRFTVRMDKGSKKGKNVVVRSECPNENTNLETDLMIEPYGCF